MSSRGWAHLWTSVDHVFCVTAVLQYICVTGGQSADARREGAEEATALDAYPRAVQEQLCAPHQVIATSPPR